MAAPRGERHDVRRARLAPRRREGRRPAADAGAAAALPLQSQLDDAARTAADPRAPGGARLATRTSRAARPEPGARLARRAVDERELRAAPREERPVRDDVERPPEP